ncbi:MAG: hypothetical protein D6712_06545 [Chloroflexi bacterium]|nr:MAG: hypothetical protein D6712_06545 [Chloroflexota bacterium]
MAQKVPSFNPANEAVLDGLMFDHKVAVPGKMFGIPGYKVNGKLAVGLFEEGFCLKLGRARVQEVLALEGVSAFEPSPGRVWRDWVLITGDPTPHKALFEEAVGYVLTETSK